MHDWAVVILAAGQGKRMKSRLPKVLHPIAGKAMVRHVVDAARSTGIERVIVVIGREASEVRRALADCAEFVEQPEPLGTGHAVLQAAEALRDVEQVLVLNADLPLISPGSLARLRQAHMASDCVLTFLSVRHPEPRGLGRIARDESGRPVAVIEESDASDQIKHSNEINVGAYCFRGDWLWSNLRRVLPSPATNEIYLTTLIEMALGEGRGAVVEASDWTEAIGVNDRIQLAQVESIMRRQIAEAHMLNGVTVRDPASTYIDATVVIGQDTEILPNTHLLGDTRIGEGCRIGPNTLIQSSVIGDDCRVFASVVEAATLEEHVEIGPFAHLRPGAYLCRGVHMGNFGEVKNARLGAGVAMGHFSYIGDADIGDETNIGAGTITCNYDGVAKHRTEVGPRSFIGSDTMLIAPVRLGTESATGAGAVVTKDVPDGFLAVGAPARLRARKPRPEQPPDDPSVAGEVGP